MLVTELKLNNYRNYPSIIFNFDPNLNIIVGKNGVGKTNILESLVVVSNTKSFRTINDQDLIKKDKEYLRIEAKDEKDIYKIVINKDSKSLFINNNLIKKSSEFIGKVNAILFKPSDLELFNQSPKERRKLLDIEIGKVSPKYLTALLRYKSLLKDKNNLLKEKDINQTLLDVIEETMIPEIKIIIEERIRFFSIINQYISDIYRQISNTDSKIEIIYKKCSEIENIKENLMKNKDKDLYYHYAAFGPHHEDYYFKMDDYDLNSIASQGQKRMVLISFKLALVKYIEETNNTLPLILLDDILSELDEHNQERLFKVIPDNTQVIITNTDINNIKINKHYKLITLKEAQDV